MLNKCKKAIISGAALTMGLSSLTVYAESLSSLQEKEKMLKEKLEYVMESKSTLDNQMQALKLQIELMNNELEQTNEEVSELEISIQDKQEELLEIQQDIDSIQKQIDEQNVELKEKREIIKKNIQFMHSPGDVAFLEFLFRSESLFQFLFRYERMKDALEQNKNLHDEVDKQLGYITQKEIQLRETRDTLEQEVINLDEMKKELDSKKERKDELMAELMEQKDELSDKLSIEKTEAQNLQKQINQTLSKIQLKVNPDNVSAKMNIVGDDVIELAVNWAKMRGKGSSNPVRYSMPRRQLSLKTYGDCSSFTRRVFMDAGYGHIGYTTAQQVTNPDGKFIESLEEIQPGDLLYFSPTGSHAHRITLPNGKRSAVAHVGIYIGDNKMVDLASGVGTISIKNIGPGERYNSYVTKRFIGAKRFER